MYFKDCMSKKKKKITPMKGILKEKSEIEKLKREYQKLAEVNFEVQETTLTQEELVLEDCEL